MKKSRIKKVLVLLTLVVVYSLQACNNNDNTPAANSPATQEVPQSTADKGAVLYQEKCAVCHGMSGDAQSSGAANLPHSVLDSMAITQTIKEGRGAMPMFKDKIADSDIGLLVVYVKGLRK